MSRKWSTRRKSLAIGLAVVGVAGLSLASASQINFDTTGATFQAGSVSVKADCQGATPVTVKYATPTFTSSATTPWTVANETFGTVDAKCSGLTYDVAYTTAAGGQSGWVSAGTGTVPSVTAPSSASIVVATPSASGVAVDVNTITGWALTIHS